MASKYIILPWDRYESLLRGQDLIHKPDVKATNDLSVHDPAVIKNISNVQMIHDPSVRKAAVNNTQMVLDPTVRNHKSRNVGVQGRRSVSKLVLNMQDKKNKRVPSKRQGLPADAPPPPPCKKRRTVWVTY
jgi:hypothetical protein